MPGVGGRGCGVLTAKGHLGDRSVLCHHQASSSHQVYTCVRMHYNIYCKWVHVLVWQLYFMKFILKVFLKKYQAHLSSKRS